MLVTWVTPLLVTAGSNGKDSNYYYTGHYELSSKIKVGKKKGIVTVTNASILPRCSPIVMTVNITMQLRVIMYALS